MNIKIENWNGHEIRFVEKAPGDWWAVAVDVTKALDIKNTTDAIKRLDPENRAKCTLDSSEGGENGISDTLHSMNGKKSGINRNVNILNEFGVYDMILASKKPEAKQFKRWVFGVIKALRQASGLEGFQIFRLLDKEHQREAMKRLHEGLESPVKVNYIKANTIANKAISIKHGLAKMIGKDKMPSDWLAERQPILDDAVDLMAANDRFGLGLSVSDAIYKKHGVTTV